MLTAEQLRKEISYNPETGRFAWKLIKKGRRADGTIGTINSHGQFVIMIDWQRYLGSRLAWLYVHGEWPKGDIDHINRDRSDNRLVNLRDVTHAQNMVNTSTRIDNSTGHRGICFDKQKGKYKVQLSHAGSKRLQKHFDKIEDAVAWRNNVAGQVFGEFNPFIKSPLA